MALQVRNLDCDLFNLARIIANQKSVFSLAIIIPQRWLAVRTCQRLLGSRVLSGQAYDLKASDGPLAWPHPRSGYEK